MKYWYIYLSECCSVVLLHFLVFELSFDNRALIYNLLIWLTTDFKFILAALFLYLSRSLPLSLLRVMRNVYPSDITSEKFELIFPFLEKTRKTTKPRIIDLYEVFCVLFFLCNICLSTSWIGINSALTFEVQHLILIKRPDDWKMALCSFYLIENQFLPCIPVIVETEWVLTLLSNPITGSVYA